MPHPNRPSYQSLRLRAKFARLALELRLLDLRQKAGFDPNQPRVPRGNPDGGQWTKIGAAAGAAAGNAAARVAAARAGAVAAGEGDDRERVVLDHSGEQTWRTYVERYRPDGSVESRTILNRDGSRITTEFGPGGTGSTDQRNTVTLADGTRFTFQNKGAAQRIFDKDGTLISDTVWTPDGPVAQPIVQQVAMGAAQAEEVLEAGRTLFEWLSTEDTFEEQAFLAFRAWAFAQVPALLLFSGTRTREETGEVCQRLGEVQRLTDEAAQEAGSPANYLSPAVYGTAVHTRLRAKVKALHDPNFDAEISFSKMLEETGTLKGSIRIDVIEYGTDGTICVYDIKTGKRGLSKRRIREFVRRVLRRVTGLGRVIVIEVRPNEQ